METTPPYELAYANAALMLALFDVLASKGMLNRDDFDNVLTAAISKLEPNLGVTSTAGAIKYIKSLLPEVRGQSAQSAMPFIDVLRREIVRMRAQANRHRHHVRQLQRAGIPTASAEALLHRMLNKIDELCAERDRMKSAQPLRRGRSW